MKIGLITYHFAENYGSALQTYGLVTYLNSQKGVEAEVIDYVSARQLSNNSLYGHRKGFAKFALNLAFLPFHYWRSRKQERFRSFVKGAIPLSDRVATLRALKQLVGGDPVSADRYDCLVSGSDQVWNPKINDFDEAFFLPFETNGKKVGYAISLGTATHDDIACYQDYMNAFDCISCRERAAVAELNDVNVHAQQVVCDPVFLLGKDKWLSLLRSSATRTKQNRPYVFCYFLYKPNMEIYFAWATKIAESLGCELKIINASFSRQTFRRGTVLDAGPLEFLDYIQNAKFVCTDSFHGTAFSVLLGKEFLSFDRAEGCVDTRKSDLLAEVGLEGRLARVGSYDGAVPAKFSQEDLEKVQEKMQEYSGKSKQFIASCIINGTLD